MTVEAEVTYALYEHEEGQQETELKTIDKNSGEKISFKPYRMQIVWRNVFAMLLLHGFALYGLTHIGRVKLQTLIFSQLIGLISTMGVQVGAHRLWSHRAYKANFGVRLFLSLAHVLALQNDLFEWCRDHRGHHKFAETDADPHNSSRGFFFSHVGWLLVKKHPDVFRRGKTIDLSDLMADPIVRFQRRFYIPMLILIWGLLPTFIPVFFWGESTWYSFLFCVMVRYVYSLNVTWLVNSWAHAYGKRPYDEKIAPVEASIRHILAGEGFHNYHHAFPWDYSASELGPLDVYNPATALINFFAYMGWAWDLKKVSPKLVEAKMASKGKQTDKVYYREEKSSTLTEWIGGLLTFFGPFSLLWYIQAY